MAVTHMDIARKAGVSQATVSRALRNNPRIGKATRARIQQIAQELEYRPDPALASLAAYRSRIRPSHNFEKVAVLIDEKWIKAPPVARRLHYEGICERGGELGFVPELCAVESEVSAQQRLSRKLHYQGVRGVIAMPLHTWVTAINWELFSVVGLGENAMPLGLHYVGADHDASVTECYRQLRQRGYRNIGFQNWEASEKRNRHLNYSAYLKCRALDGLGFAEPLYYHTDQDRANILPWLRKFQFDAIICVDLHLPKFLKGSEFKVPEDVGIAAFDMPLESAVDHGYAACITDFLQIGRQSMEFLQSLIQMNRYGIPDAREQNAVFLRGYWHEGPTVRPLKQ